MIPANLEPVVIMGILVISFVVIAIFVTLAVNIRRPRNNRGWKDNN